MADVLFIGWNRARAGLEKEALEAFASAVAFFGKAAAAGQIDSFEPVLLNIHGGDLNGFVLVRGGAKLEAFRNSDEFRDLIIQADMYVSGMGVIEGFTGEGLQKELGRFQKYIK